MSDMPEILFRGKQLKGSEWFVGDLSRVVHNDGRQYVFPADGYNSPEWYEVDPSTVGRYTGLTDKNGVKIFKGDILHVHDITLQCSKPYHEFDGYVDFSFGMFRILDANGVDKFQWPDYEIEVIGNIFDNKLEE